MSGTAQLSEMLQRGSVQFVASTTNTMASFFHLRNRYDENEKEWKCSIKFLKTATIF